MMVSKGWKWLLLFVLIVVAVVFSAFYGGWTWDDGVLLTSL